MLDNHYFNDNTPTNDSGSQNAYACPAVGTHYALIGVPVTVKPFAIPGHISVECCDSPFMETGENCRGKIGAVCHFTVSQMLKIEIPIDFGAAVRIGEAHIDCGKSVVGYGENCADNCR